MVEHGIGSLYDGVFVFFINLLGTDSLTVGDRSLLPLDQANEYEGVEQSKK